MAVVDRTHSQSVQQVFLPRLQTLTTTQGTWQTCDWVHVTHKLNARRLPAATLPLLPLVPCPRSCLLQNQARTLVKSYQ